MLFDCEGALHRIDWSKVINDLATENPAVQTAIRVAFSDSDLFYNSKVRKVLFDPHIQSPIKLQLENLAELHVAVSRKTWHANWNTEDTPFDFLPTDTDVYYNHIFAGGDEGLYSTPRTAFKPGGFFKKQPFKHHDARMMQIRASDRFTAVAAAAGADGLFEFKFARDEADVLNEHKQLAKRPCSACDWAFQSVMGWTSDSAFLANFNQERDSRTNRVARSFDRLVEVQEMFGDRQDLKEKTQTWGCREKIYRISKSGLEVSNYSPAQLKRPKGTKKPLTYTFINRGSTGPIDGNYDFSSPIATGTAPFGTILEFDDRVVVLRSDGEIEEYIGEPVHWRVFPRSEHYSNQLHIIYDDKIVIISFVHDYFVDQVSKLYGFSRATGNVDLGEA